MHTARCLGVFLATSLLAGVFLPETARAAARLDLRPVSAADLGEDARGRQRKAPASNEPAVLVDWYRARAHCAARGKRLPSAAEWTAACEAGELEFPWWIWEWTTTEAEGSGTGFKLLCGPGGTTCGCTHAYDPSWSNEVKGFRCATPLPSVRWGGTSELR